MVEQFLQKTRLENNQFTSNARKYVRLFLEIRYPKIKRLIGLI